MSLLNRGPGARHNLEAKSAVFHSLSADQRLLTGTARGTERRGALQARPGLFETCANPGCTSGWLSLAQPLGAGL